MKIGPLESKPTTAPATTERSTASGSKAGSTTEASAKVDLSTAATALSTGQADPAFDTKKVERIAQAIRDGQFQVNAEAIADKLIVNAAELLGRKPS
jgi:negative regulator of flagellin synthesis FlgM